VQHTRVMSEQIRVVQYQYILTDVNASRAADILNSMTHAGIDLLAVSVFPRGSGKIQVDLITSGDGSLLQAASEGAGWTLSGKRSGFHIQGEDRPNAIGEVLDRLAKAEIGVTWTQAIAAGAGRFGALLWVNAADVRKAAELLDASPLPEKIVFDDVEEASKESFPASDPPSFSPTSIG